MKFLTVFIIFFASYANAFTAQIKSVELFDGEKINAEEKISNIKHAIDRKNKIDFIELTDGRIIDSFDIENVRYDESSMAAARMGNGSGG